MAFLHIEGTRPFSKQTWNNRYHQISTDCFLITSFGMQSTPVALPFFNFVTAASTSSTVISVLIMAFVQNCQFPFLLQMKKTPIYITEKLIIIICIIYIIITKNIRYLLWNQGLWRSLNNTYPIFLTPCIRLHSASVSSVCDLTSSDLRLYEFTIFTVSREWSGILHILDNSSVHKATSIISDINSTLKSKQNFKQSCGTNHRSPAMWYTCKIISSWVNPSIYNCKSAILYEFQ